MTWLYDYFRSGYQIMQQGGNPLPRETVLNFQTGATLSDNPTNAATVVNIGSAFSITGTGFPYVLSSATQGAAVTLTGDVSQGALSGSNVPLTVTALQGHAVSNTAPTTNYVLTWNGSAWAPAAAASSAITQLTGDVLAGPGSGSVSATVVAIQGQAVSSTTPTTNYVLAWNGSHWISTNPYSLEGVTGTGFWFSTSGSLGAAGVSLTGDVSQGALSGSNVPLTVTALQGHAVSNTAPTTNYVLTWSGSAWAPAVLPATTVTGTGFYWSASGALNPAAITVNGDVTQGSLSGSNVGLTVVALQTYAVSASAPSSANVLVYHSSAWTPTALSGDITVTSTGVTTLGAIDGNTLPSPSGTTTYLTWTGSALSWTTNSIAAAVTGTGFWYSNSGALHTGAITLTGDVSQGALSGSNVPLTVTALQTYAVANSAPSSAEILVYHSSAWTPTAVSGDLTLSSTGVGTVTALQTHAVSATAPNTANLLIYASSTWTPTAMTGDVTITSSGVTTLGAIDGNTLPAPTGTNTYLEWTGSALQWANVSVLWGSDLVNSTGTNQYVSSISYSSSSAGGTIAINGTGTAFQVAAGNTGFVFNQASTSSGSGAAFTIAAQNATGATHAGGNLVLSSGSSGSAKAGEIQLQIGGTTQLQIDNAVTTSGTITYLLGDGTNAQTITSPTATSTTPPTLTISSATGYAAANTSGAGGALNITAGSGTIASSGSANGAHGGAVTITSGAGAAGSATNQNGGAGGNLVLYSGAGGASGGGSGVAGSAGTITLVVGGTTYFEVSVNGVQANGLSTGIVQTNGSGIFSSGAINLGTIGSSYITGTLGYANGGTGLNTLGTAGQFLLVNSGATAMAWTTLSQDVTASATTVGQIEVTGLLANALPSLSTGYLEWTGSAWAFGTAGTVTWASDLVNSSNSAQYVSSLSYSSSSGGGAIAIKGTGTSLAWAATNTAPLITQTAAASTSSGSGAAGYNTTVSAQAGQAATGATHNGGAGGNLVLNAGAGGTSGSATAGNVGEIQFQLGGVTYRQLDYGVTSASTITETLGDGTHALQWTQLASVQSTPPTFLIQSASGYAAASVSGAGGAFTITAGPGTIASSGTANGAAGGALTLNAGYGAAGLGGTSTGGAGGAFSVTAGAGGAGVSTGLPGNGGAISFTAGNGGAGHSTSNNSNGGNITLTAGNAGTGGSGSAGSAGYVELATSGGTLLVNGSGTVQLSSLGTGVVQSSGSGLLTSSALNLAGGSSYVSGLLPVGNMAYGSASQFLVTNATPNAAEWISLSGDVSVGSPGSIEVTGLLAHALPSLTTGYLNYSGSAWQLSSVQTPITWANDLVNSSATAQYVSSLSYSSSSAGGTIAINGTGSVLQWALGNTGPAFNQAAPTPTNTPAAGASFTIQAQAGTAAVSGNNNGGTGGELILTSGAGGAKQGSGTAGVAGALVLQAGGTTYLSIAGASGAVTLANLGTGIVQSSNVGLLTSGAINLGTIGSSYITGTLGLGNGGTGLNTTSFTTGNVLQATSGSVIGYAAINLAGGSNYVTGALPVANLANGTAGQVLITNSGATAPAWTTISGDITASTSTVGKFTLSAIDGVSLPTPSGTNVFLEYTGSSLVWASAGGVTWANDLASSSSSNQYVSGLSGSSGTGGSITVGDGIHTTTLTGVTATTGTSPDFDLTGSAGLAGTSGSTGGQIVITAGAGGAGSSTTGGFGGNLVLMSGAGGATTSGSNAVPGHITIATGALGTGGTGSTYGTIRFGLTTANDSESVLKIDYGNLNATTTTFLLNGGSTFGAHPVIFSTYGSNSAGTTSPSITFQTGTGGSSSGAGSAAGAIAITPGTGGAGVGSTSGGGAGGAFTVTGGAGGAPVSTGTGGAGGAVTLTTGGGANGVATTGAGGAAGNFSVVIGTPGTSVTGNAGAAGTVSIIAGTGGAATNSSGSAKAGGSLTLKAGPGGAATGTGVNSNGGAVVIASGAAGTGGSGTAGTAGTISLQINATTYLAIAATGAVTLANLGTGIVQSSSVGLLTSGAINLGTIGSSYITGTLALGNGGTGLNTTSFTQGNVLQATSSSVIGYAAVNLAGGANYVTGALPVANLANGTAGQLLVTNSGATAPAWVTLSGDSTLTAAGVMENTGLLNNALPSLTSGYLEWTGSAWAFGTGGGGGSVTWANDLVNSTSVAQYVSAISYSSSSAGGAIAINGTGTTFAVASGNTAFTFSQTAQGSTSSGSGAAGYNFAITAQAGQAATGASHNGGAGGALILGSGAGGTSGSATAGAAGVIELQIGGTTEFQIGSSATAYQQSWVWGDTAVNSSKGTQILITQPTASGSGTQGGGLYWTSQAGTQGSASGTGGTGGILQLVAGAAGAGGATSGAGGVGGELSLGSGAGGAATASNSTGGAGGETLITTGNGGAGSGSNAGGASGLLELLTGNGGNGGATGAGGNANNIYLVGGTGGNGGATSGNGGNGGSIYFEPGAGGTVTSGTAGKQGTVQVLGPSSLYTTQLFGQSGTQNSQTNTISRTLYNLRINSNSATTYATIPLSTSSTACTIAVTWSGRLTSSLSFAYGGFYLATVYNNAGSLSVSTTSTVVGSTWLSATTSGTNILLQVTGNQGASSVDLSFIVDVIVN